jgi:hypothetical protein
MGFATLSNVASQCHFIASVGDVSDILDRGAAVDDDDNDDDDCETETSMSKSIQAIQGYFRIRSRTRASKNRRVSHLLRSGRMVK